MYVRSETDLFTEPGFDVSLLNTNNVEYHPVSTLTDKSPISFNIHGDDVHYIDMNQMALYLRCKITSKAGANVPDYATTKISCVNNLLHSLFQQCTIHLNETQITPNTSLYAYRAYMETVLAYGGDYKDSQGRASLYIKDSDVSSVDDEAFKARAKIISEGKEFDLIGRPFVDICSQNRYLIPGIDVRVTFHRSPDDFFMHSETTNPQVHYKCVISEARLVVRKHTVLPMILNQHLKLWESGYPCCYPMRRVEMKTYSLPLGTIQNINENLLNGMLPDRLIIALCKSNDMNGKLTTSPFDFKDFGLKQITVSANGDQIFTQTYDVDVTNNRIAQVYYNMYDALGLGASNEGPDITMEQFIKGKLFFIYNLRQINDGQCLPRFGNVKIEVKFAAALAHTINVVCHSEYQSLLYIDNKKSVYFKEISADRI